MTWDEFVKYANSILQDTPAWKLVEMEITALDHGRAEMVLEVKDKHLNPSGVCHGGIIATLADTVMGVALRTMGVIGTTMEMNINYMVPVNKGEKIIAKGEVLRKGKSTAVIKADLFVKDNMVAVSRSTYYILKELDKEQGMKNDELRGTVQEVQTQGI